MYVRTYVCMCMCMYMHVHACTCIYVHVYVRTCMYMQKRPTGPEPVLIGVYIVSKNGDFTTVPC